MTLVELLVAIAIIALLMALLLVAVQAVRETARMTQCSNHLKQLGQAALQHERAQGHFPTGGWGYTWVGDPDAGFGVDQPGGFFYNCLPYLEQTAVRDMGAGLGRGTTANAKGRVAAEMIAATVPVLTCPSRRSPQACPFTNAADRMRNIAWPTDGTPRTSFRADYAVNGGSVFVPWSEGPTAWLPQGRIDASNLAGLCNGLSFQQSIVKLDHVQDGASSTYLAGEKHVNPAHYTTGRFIRDDQPAFSGDDLDLHAWTDELPSRDERGSGTGYGSSPTLGNLVRYSKTFGSAHSRGFGVVLCDGSVRRIAYAIDAVTHNRLGDRADGRPVNQGDE